MGRAGRVGINVERVLRDPSYRDNLILLTGDSVHVPLYQPVVVVEGSHRFADLVARLEKKTGRKVKARVSVDKALIGGVKIVLGDKVIDGSARAQLSALENSLKA